MGSAAWIFVLAAVLVLGVAGEEKPEDLPSQDKPTEEAEARVKRQGGGIGNNFILPTFNNFRNRASGGNFGGNSRANQFLNRPVQIGGGGGGGGGGRGGFSRNSSPSNNLRVLNSDPLGLFNRQSNFQSSVQRFQGGQVSSTTFPPSFQQQSFNQRNFSPQRFTPSAPQAFGGRQNFNQGQRGFQPTPVQFAQNLAQRQQAQASFRSPQPSRQTFAQNFGSRPSTAGAQRPGGVLLQQTRPQRPPTAAGARGRPLGVLSQQTRPQRPSTAGGRPVGGLSQQTGLRTSPAGAARRPTGVQQTRPQTPATGNSVQRVSGVRFQPTGTQRPTGAQGFSQRPNSGVRFFVDSREDSREFILRNNAGRTQINLPNRGFQQQNVANFGNRGFQPRPGFRVDLDLTQEDLTNEFNSRERFFPSVLGGRAFPVGGRTQVNRPNPFNQGFRGRPNFQVEVDVTREDLSREFDSREIFLRTVGGTGRAFSSATARPQIVRPNPSVQAFRSNPRVEIDIDVTREDDSRELFLQSIRNTGNLGASRPLGRPAITPNRTFRPQGNVRVDVDLTTEDLTREFNSREVLLQNTGFGRTLTNTRPQTFRTSPPRQTFQTNQQRQTFPPRPTLQVELDVTREDLDDTREIFLQRPGNRPSFASATARPQAFRPSSVVQSFRSRPGVRVDFDLTREDNTREIDDSREFRFRPTGGRGRFQQGVSRTSSFRPRPVLQVDLTREDFDNDDTFELFDD
ncbi:uncharacterized protein LOC122255846 isoform X2 [Penaeus japonicus]|uniref:uncharacterized protein LOC122255846 isoform X2 n=1 Tax=Penaeus japonicus TaxID=27405 RepID=UPI001C70C9BF|nr:uncharacterized protein LOC122255846 isoform X2 [Penaeus japonicus]